MVGFFSFKMGNLVNIGEYIFNFSLTLWNFYPIVAAVSLEKSLPIQSISTQNEFKLNYNLNTYDSIVIIRITVLQNLKINTFVLGLS